MFKETFPTFNDFEKYVRKHKTLQHNLEIEWCVGGMTGGSCWGDEPTAREADPEPEFEGLELILEDVFPEITFLQFRKIQRECIRTKEWTDREYYGNYWNKVSRSVNLEKLYDFLIDMA